MLLRILVALLAAFLALTPVRAELSERQWRSLDGMARGRFSGRWQEFDTNELAVLRQRADGYLQHLRDHCLSGGVVVGLRYDRVDGTNVVAYESLGDSATLTGLAIAACTFQYAVTREPAALADIRAMLDGLERLQAAAARPGYLPAFAGRADDPAYKPVYATFGGPDPARPGFGRLAHPCPTNPAVIWLGGADRERYSALTFGLSMAWQVVREPRLREQTGRILGGILDQLIADGWKIRDGAGETVFVPPLLSAAMLRSGMSLVGFRFDRPYIARATELLGLPPPSLAIYGDNRRPIFGMLDSLVLARLETDSSRRLLFQDRLTQMWRQSQRLLNPLLAATYAEAFERPPNDMNILATLEGTLGQFPSAPRWSRAPAAPDTNYVVTIAANGRTWSKFALPFTNQAAATLQWWQSPCLLAEPTSEPVVFPGVDYLLAFWMGRDSSVLPSEDAPPAAAKLRARPTRTNAPPTNPKPPAAARPTP